MSIKIFFQIILLMIIGALIFVVVCPKYEYVPNPNPGPSKTWLLRFNRITGVLQVKDGRDSPRWREGLTAPY
jgi:hypothetical protein